MYTNLITKCISMLNRFNNVDFMIYQLLQYHDIDYFSAMLCMSMSSDIVINCTFIIKVVVTAGASMQNYKIFVMYSIFKSIKDNFSNF